MIFKEGIRNITTHKKAKSSSFEFLDNSAWSICDLLRGYFTYWVTDFESDHEFINRFKSKNLKQHFSAELELLLYTMLKNEGFLIEKHPSLGTAKRLDFKVTPPKSEPLLIECTLAGDSFDSLSDQNLKSTIEEIIDEIEYHPYFINITFNTLSKTSISQKRLLHFLEEVRLKSEGIANDELLHINHQFEDNGWQLEFSMLRKPQPVRKRSLGFMMNHAKAINTSKPLLTSLNDKKPSKYGIMKQPYIICVNSSDQFGSEECFSEALFGQYAKDFIYTDRIFPDGFFLNKERQNTTVAAVLFFRQFGSYILDKTECSLWHNPYAKFPVPQNILPFDEFIFKETEDRLEIHVLRKEKTVIDLLEMDKEKYLYCKQDKPVE